MAALAAPDNGYTGSLGRPVDQSHTRRTIMANDKTMARICEHDGFTAALDQSGGSTPVPYASTASQRPPIAMMPKCSALCTRCACAL